MSSAPASARPARRRLLVAAVLGVVLLLLVAAVVETRRGGPAPAEPTYHPGRVLAADTFTRTLPKGWGPADVGGSWTLDGGGGFGVRDGVGRIALPAPGAARSAGLDAGHPQDLTASVTVVAPTAVRRGSGVYVALRYRVAGNGHYRSMLRFAPDRRVWLSVSRLGGSADERVDLLREQVVATGVRPGDRVRLTTTVTGTSPVRIVVAAGAGRTAPAPRTVTDAAASRLVAGGTVGLWAYVAGRSGTGATAGFDDLEVRQQVAEGAGDPDGGPGPGSTGSGSGPPASPGADSSTAVGAPRIGGTAYPVPAGAVFAGPAGRPSGPGTEQQPFDSVARAVAAAPDGGTVVLRAGSYREHVRLPAGKRLTLQPYPGEAVWLDGSRRVTGWQRRGHTWQVPWRYRFDASPTYTRGAPDGTRPGWRFVNPAHPMAAHPDQVWLDGRALSQVAHRNQLTAARFLVDPVRHVLVLGADPAGREVRASSVAQGLTVAGAGDVVRGIGVRRYATSVWQMGAATVNADHVRVEDVVVADNATTGLSVTAADARLTRVTAMDNGLMGVHGHRADGLVADGLAVSGNNREHFNRAPAAGGMKVTSSKDVTVRRSSFTGNAGHGLWFDDSSSGVTLAGFRAQGNDGAGAVVEVSSRVAVVDDVLADNAVHGLWVIDTDRVEVAGTTMAGNGDGDLALVTDARSRPGARGAGLPADDPALPWVTRDVTVYDNVLASAGSEGTVAVADYTARFDGRELGVSIDHNLYALPPGQGPAFASWSIAGRPAATYPDLAAWREATGQDLASAAVERSGAVDAEGRLDVAVRQETEHVARPLSPAAAAVAGAEAGSARLGAGSP